MADNQREGKIPRYLVLTGAAVTAIIVAIGTAFVLQDHRDKALEAEIERTQSELLGLGGQITAVKDADLTTTNHYIAGFRANRAYSERIRHEVAEIQ